MATITDGVSTITPDLILGWRSTRTSRTVLHTVIGKPDPDVTLRPSGLRAGVLRLFFLTSDDAHAAEALHTTAAVLHLDADPEQPDLSMAYVTAGPVDYAAATDEGRHWTLDVTYQEVTP